MSPFFRPLRPARRMLRRWRRRRLMRGPFSLLLFGGAAAAYKFNHSDVQRMEQATGKSADDLTEEELLAAMRRLGINKLELDSDDLKAVNQADSE